jgi:hypothetical protein
MSLASLVRSAVAVADRVTSRGGLQVTVTHKTVTARSASNAPTYSAGTARNGLLEFKTRTVKRIDGIETLSHAKLSMLFRVTVNQDDQFTLPDGTTPPIVDVRGGLADPESGTYLTEVYFG